MNICYFLWSRESQEGRDKGQDLERRDKVLEKFLFEREDNISERFKCKGRSMMICEFQV